MAKYTSSYEASYGEKPISSAKWNNAFGEVFDKLHLVRTNFIGTSFPTGDDIEVGETVYRSDEGYLYVCTATDTFEKLAKFTDLIASNIGIVDAGGYFTATEVESALQEAMATLGAHTSNTSNPHNVTAVQASYNNTISGLSANNVQDAIDEIDSVLDNHLADNTNPHDVTASQVSYNNTTSGLSANNVQDAIDTLDAIVDTINSTLSSHTSNNSNPHNVTAAQIGGANILAELLGVDGAGSGLDADKVDGVDFNTSTTDPTGTTRLNAECYFYATRVYNAVFNDFAECFDNGGLIYDDVKNRIVEIDYTTGKVSLAKECSRAVVGIVSDSYGYLLNGSEEDIKSGKKIPVGMAGTLWVDAESQVNEDSMFNFVCSGVDGTARVIPVGEAYKYEGMVVGKIIGLDKDTNKYKIILCLK